MDAQIDADELAQPNLATRLGRHLSIGLMFALPVSTSALDALLIAITACWILGGDLMTKLRVIRDNRIVQASLVLFTIYALAVTWSTAPLADALDSLGKYRKLLFIPVLIPFFSKRWVRHRAIRAFQLGMIVTLIASALMWFGVLESKYSYGFADNCAYFKNHITQNVLMALFIFSLAHELPITDWFKTRSSLRVVDQTSATTNRWLWLLPVSLIGISTFNLFIMVHGRTGYIVLFALIALFMYQQFGTRRFVLGSTLLCVSAIGAYFASAKIQQRVDLAVSEARSFQETGVAGEESSIGRRFTFYRVALGVLRDSPIIGSGTGSFETEMARREGPDALLSKNPHGEYFNAGVQAGLIGVAAFVTLLSLQWRASYSVPIDVRPIAQGIVVLMALGSLVNSLLLDATEGNLFCIMTAMTFGQAMARTVRAENSANQDSTNRRLAA